VGASKGVLQARHHDLRGYSQLVLPSVLVYRPDVLACPCHHLTTTSRNRASSISSVTVHGHWRACVCPLQVADLLQCYTVTTNCSLARELLTLPNPAPKTPINRYVGVSSAYQSTVSQ